MFLGVLLKEGSHFHLHFENKPENNIYFRLKPQKLDNIPSIRYKLISHHVPNVKQHIRLY